jgi:hypothetical protein
MNVVATIFFVEDLPIPGHKYRNRIRKQEHPGGDGASRAVDARVPDSGVLEIDRIHQVVQRHVGIAPTQTRKQWSKKSQEGIQRIPAKRTEEQIEPHHIGFQFPDCLQKTNRTRGIVECPATPHRKTIQLGLVCG